MLILIGQPDALKRLTDEAKLKLVRDENTGEIDAADDDIGVMEAIVTADSPLVDRSATQYRLYQHHQVNLLAVSRSGRRIAHRIGSTRLKPGVVRPVPIRVPPIPRRRARRCRRSGSRTSRSRTSARPRIS